MKRLNQSESFLINFESLVTGPNWNHLARFNWQQHRIASVLLVIQSIYVSMYTYINIRLLYVKLNSSLKS